MWAAIQSGAAERDPSLLQPLAFLSYCDLKHFKYRYWFGFPALQPPEPFAATSPPASLAADVSSGGGSGGSAGPSAWGQGAVQLQAARQAAEQKQQEQRLWREARLLRRCASPCIVQLLVSG